MQGTTDAAPDPGALLDQKARRLAAQGQLEEAAGAFREVLAHDGNHLPALNFLAQRAWAAGRLDESLELLGRALTVNPAQPTLHLNAALVQVAKGDVDAALAEFDQALALKPDHLGALLHKASALDTAGRVREAATPYLRAMTLAADPAKVFGGRPPPANIAELLRRARQVVQQTRHELLGEALTPLRERYGADALARLDHALDIYLGRAVAEYPHPKQRPATLFFPGLPPRPFFEREEFPWLGGFEAATADIRAELEAVLQTPEEFKPYVDKAPGSADARYWQDVNRSTRWSTFRLFKAGASVEDNCRRCPLTVAALESIPLMRVPGFSPEAMFSVLEPHTRIPAHHGSVNGRLIVHLPLIVPENCGGLRVADETRGWQEAQCLVFDDSFAHEAWNDSERTRVVLIFDIWNPLLSEAEKAGFAAALEAMGRFNYAALGEAALKDG